MMATIQEIEAIINKLETKLTEEISKTIKAETDKLHQRITQLDDKLKLMSNRITQNEKDVKDIINAVNDNQEAISSAQFEIRNLQESVKILEDQLDDQIDRNMRETLIIHGIKGTETLWDATKKLLCSFLEELSEGELNRNDIHYSIVRAHRGGKENKAIYVKFNDHSMMDSIKDLRFKKNGIFINQLRSPKINQRIKEASKLKSELRKKEKSKNWKIFINEKVQLMVKKPNENRYCIHKQF